MRGIYYVSEDAIGNYNPRRTMESADYASIFGWLTADGDIAVESIYGPLDEGYWDRCFNDYITIASKIEQHAKNGAIKAIVLAIDSPGGAVNGLFSLRITSGRFHRKSPYTRTYMAAGHFCSICDSCGVLTCVHRP